MTTKTIPTQKVERSTLPVMLEISRPALDFDPLREETVDHTVRQARFADRPCQLHRYHSPCPSRTQGHHRQPVYLQNRIYGHIRDSELLWVCGTCHDNIHEWLSFLLGEARKPSPSPGRKAKAEAQRTYEWYKQALKDRDEKTT